jgi:hypothetical protein
VRYLQVRTAALALALAAAAFGFPFAARGTAQTREVPAGSYECWFDGRARMGLNFKILPGGRYADVENTTGTYAFIAPEEIVFRGGALDGQHAQHKTGSRTVSFISARRVLLASCDRVK